LTEIEEQIKEGHILGMNISELKIYKNEGKKSRKNPRQAFFS